MMFWDGNGGGVWHPWVMVLMWVGFLLFWMLVIWGGIALFRSSERRPPPTDLGPDPERILKERLARGEIDREQYEQLRQVVRS